jgi:monoterpene epsilon-lactone hydrolase
MDGTDPQATPSPRQVAARAIPTPRTVSPALQRSIAAAAAAPPALAFAPQTPDQWRAFAASAGALSLQRLDLVKAQFPFTLTERRIAGVTVREVTPATLDPARAGQALVHLHGGGYVIYGGEAGLPEAVLGAHYARTPVLSVDYRMPPDHPFPAAVDDAVAVWTALIGERAPASMGVFGSSAGGGLALAMTMKLKALGAPLPGALAPGTPWADLSGESDSYATNADVDGVLPRYDGALAAMARLYAGGAGLADPLVSPVRGDFTGFPPSILTTGTRDILLSDTVRVYRRMRAAGVAARLEVYEAMSHAEYSYAFDSPESAEVFTDIARFFDQHLVR